LATPLVALILAAGEGLRMRSRVPKVLHEAAGLPLLEYALRLAAAAGASRTFVVTGSSSREVETYVGKRARIVRQGRLLGTGHAVLKAAPAFRGVKGDLLVLYGDSPLLRPQTLKALKQLHRLSKASATLVTATLEDPFGYGRIVRKPDSRIVRIIEEWDANEDMRRIREVNSGVCLFRVEDLMPALGSLKPDRRTGHYRLTDTVAWLLERGRSVQALTVTDPDEVLGVNDRSELAEAHRLLTLRRVESHQRNGVTFLDPERVEIGPEVVIAEDCVIEGGVILSGRTLVKRGCRLGSGSELTNALLGEGVRVRGSLITDSEMGDFSDAGPHAHVRGGSVVGPGVHLGTGAEVKGSRMGQGTKAGHFCYVGDAELGRDVNVGAGCVFANYDGRRKHRTVVGDGAFLGSNSTLVAPVRVGKRAVVGAGAVVTRDVAPGARVVGVPARPIGR
jgi:bifunctional UDP-N-acetylglucosamine pyrophosphorylase/glucosamine-1-phosphate N-acetyltransferase